MGNEYGSFSTGRAAALLALALACWLLLGPVCAYAFMSWELFSTPPLDTAGSYLAVHIPYLLLFIVLLGGSRLLLRLPLGRLMSGNSGHIRWGYSAGCGLVYLILLLIISFFSRKGIEPGCKDVTRWLLLLPFVLVCTPIQACSEELVFRVLPARIAFRDTLPESLPRMLPLSLLSGVLFMLPHLMNIEVQVSANAALTLAYYFLWGALAMLLALSSGGFEAPLSIHTVNNLYIALIVNYKDSSMPSESLFINNETPSPLTNLLSAAAIFLVLFLYSWKRGYLWRHHAG